MKDEEDREYALMALSSVDGRYKKYARMLDQFFSEMALMKYRMGVEISYLIALSEHPLIHLKKFTKKEENLRERNKNNSGFGKPSGNNHRSHSNNFAKRGSGGGI